MTEKQFNAELASWLKRALEGAQKRVAKLQRVQKGDAKLQRVYVRPHVVPQHKVRGHYRWV